MARFRLRWIVLLMLALPVAADAAIFGLTHTPASTSPTNPYDETNGPTTLFRYNESGPLDLTLIGGVTINGAPAFVDGLAISPIAGAYAFNVTGDTASGPSQLVSIDLTTAEATTIGSPIAGRRIMGAAFSINGRTLYAIDTLSFELITVDIHTGQVTSAVTLIEGGSPFVSQNTVVDEVDIAVDRDNNFFFVEGSPAGVGGRFYALNPSTGALTLLFTEDTAGSAAFNRPVGIAFSALAPANRLFTYNARSADDLVYYNLPNAPRTIQLQNLTEFNGLVGDLAAAVYLPEPSGLFLFTVAAGLLLRRAR